jgi:transcriptional regulator with XRE-family HTH domain
MTNLPSPASDVPACVEFADELRRLRQEKGVGQSELARRVDVKQPYLSAVERLVRPAPSQSIIDRMCVALSLSKQEAATFTDTAAAARKHWKDWLRSKNPPGAPKIADLSIEILVNGVSLIQIAIPHLPTLEVRSSAPSSSEGVVPMT